MLLKIAAVVIGLVTLLCVYVAFQPADFKIQRTGLIKAAPDKVFENMVSARKSYAWMPWKDMDPNIHIEFTGPEAGVGSEAKWQSEGQMGVGLSRVIQIDPNQSVKTEIVYEKPMQMQQLATMSLQPDPNGTLLTWSVEGKNNFIGRLICLFIHMDKQVGDNFEKGFANLNAILKAEASPQPR